MSFTLRTATPEDAAGIAEIHYAGWLNAYGSVVPPEQMEKKRPEKRVPFWRERIADPEEIVLVAHDDAGRMQGFVHGGKVLPHDITKGSLAGFDCEIYVLHCRKETQGRGLGRRLIAGIARAFRARGKSALVLWAYTDNAYRPFYDRLGGEVVAEGLDEGVADVAYGWRALDAVIGTEATAVAPEDAEALAASVRRHTHALVYHLVFSAAGIAMLVMARDARTTMIGIGVIFCFLSWLPLTLTRLLRALVQRDAAAKDMPRYVRVFRLGIGDSVTRVLPFLGMALACVFIGSEPGFRSIDPLWAIGAIVGVVLALVYLGYDIAYRAGLTLSPAGLDYTPFQVGPIAWTDIAAAELDLAKGRRLLRFTPRDAETLFQRGLPRQGTRGGLLGLRAIPPFVIDLTRIGDPDVELLAAIRLRLAAFSGTQTPSFST
jgi:GNAT superfamily N-acetyltransferase